MARYQIEIEPIILAEGEKYENHPMDRGGPTKFGITLERLKLYRRDPSLNARHVKELTKDEAIAIYKADYWDINRCDEMHQIVAHCLFNIGVNMGPITGAKLLQIAINNLSNNHAYDLVTDGKIGPITLRELSGEHPIHIAAELIKLMQDRYVSIVKRNPSQIVFLAGWINRSQKLMDDVIAHALSS